MHTDVLMARKRNCGESRIAGVATSPKLQDNPAVPRLPGRRAQGLMRS